MKKIIGLVLITIMVVGSINVVFAKSYKKIIADESFLEKTETTIRVTNIYQRHIDSKRSNAEARYASDTERYNSTIEECDEEQAAMDAK